MAVSEQQKIYNREWDRDNMRTLSCRVRTEEYELFKIYCEQCKTTPGKLLKDYVEKSIGDNADELKNILRSRQEALKNKQCEIE